MRVFLDANVLVATLNKEYPVFTYSSRVLSLSASPQYDLYTSSLGLAICYYFSAKKSGEKAARKKIGILKDNIKLAVISENAVNQALSNPKIIDLEDGFQYYAAKAAGCTCIVTEDLSDYFFAEIEVLDSKSFLECYVFDRKKKN
ncbi:MAG: type II toxin-antitoxin system VapC family toxin [Ekhidna sp.]|uniref:type II toxin-antitoxin system VapC family toxin n=1 Tax=Ekhidna sp. TaxID=2608089 RepID=UPI0032ECC600